MSDPIPYEKLKMNDGWYCVRDKRVINKSDVFCPAPIGSRLFTHKGCVSVNPDDNVVMVRHDDVISWLELEDMNEEDGSNA